MRQWCISRGTSRNAQSFRIIAADDWWWRSRARMVLATPTGPVSGGHTAIWMLVRWSLRFRVGVVDLPPDLLGKRRVTELFLGHAVNVSRMLRRLGHNVIIVVRHDDTVTIEAKVPAMQFSRHARVSGWFSLFGMDPIPL